MRSVDPQKNYRLISQNTAEAMGLKSIQMKFTMRLDIDLLFNIDIRYNYYEFQALPARDK